MFPGGDGVEQSRDNAEVESSWVASALWGFLQPLQEGRSKGVQTLISPWDLNYSWLLLQRQARWYFGTPNPLNINK
jgi:hypothetical protein